MVDYTVSIKRPFSDLTKLAIGILLSIIPIVNFIAVGYTLACAKTAMKKKYSLPEWKEIGGYFVKGFLSGVIALIYMIIPIGVIAFTAGTIGYAIWTAIMTGATPAIGSLFVGAGFGLIVGLILMLFAMYILPIAVLSYISADKFGAAFEIGTVLRKSFSVSYFVSWIVAIAYSVILMIILSWIPFIGPAIASFIGGVTIWTIFGQVYSELK
jgi:hypothetical protein